jgi:hypothetical protein
MILNIKIELIFKPNHKVLPTGGHVPTALVKHIYFSKKKVWRCFHFPNEKPTKPWEQHEFKHKH